MATVNKKTTGAAKKGSEGKSVKPKPSTEAKGKKGAAAKPTKTVAATASPRVKPAVVKTAVVKPAVVKPAVVKPAVVKPAVVKPAPVKPKPGDNIIPNNPISRLVSGYVNFNDGQAIKATVPEKPGRILGLLFTAEWCVPCKPFINRLVHWWRVLPEADRQITSIIYCSSDTEEDAYQEHIDRVPDDLINWHYIPWSEGKAVTTMKHFKTRFGVEGIPILLFIEADTGLIIRTDGRALIDADPEGKEREWKPLNLREELLSAQLIRCPLIRASDEEHFERASPNILKDTYIGLLFFSDLFMSCVKFVPILNNLIKIIRKKHKFEVVYINAENEREKFYDHFHGDIPWLALLHTDVRRPKLARRFNITLVPQLIILDKNFKVVCHDAHLGAMHDPQGEDFPWREKPVLRLTDQFAMALNVCPCLIWITDGSSKQIENATTVMYPIALKFFKRQRPATEFWDIRFFFLGADKRFTRRVKQFASLSTEEEDEEEEKDDEEEEDEDEDDESQETEVAGDGACANSTGRQMVFLVNNPEREIFHLDKLLDDIDLLSGETPTTESLSYFIEEVIAGNRIGKKMKDDDT